MCFLGLWLIHFYFVTPPTIFNADGYNIPVFLRFAHRARQRRPAGREEAPRAAAHLQESMINVDSAGVANALSFQRGNVEEKLRPGAQSILGSRVGQKSSPTETNSTAAHSTTAPARQSSGEVITECATTCAAVSFEITSSLTDAHFIFVLKNDNEIEPKFYAWMLTLISITSMLISFLLKPCR